MLGAALPPSPRSDLTAPFSWSGEGAVLTGAVASVGPRALCGCVYTSDFSSAAPAFGFICHRYKTCFPRRRLNSLPRTMLSLCGFPLKGQSAPRPLIPVCSLGDIPTCPSPCMCLGRILETNLSRLPWDACRSHSFPPRARGPCHAPSAHALVWAGCPCRVLCSSCPYFRGKHWSALAWELGDVGLCPFWVRCRQM